MKYGLSVFNHMGDVKLLLYNYTNTMYTDGYYCIVAFDDEWYIDAIDL